MVHIYGAYTLYRSSGRSVPLRSQTCPCTVAHLGGGIAQRLVLVKMIVVVLSLLPIREITNHGSHVFTLRRMRFLRLPIQIANRTQKPRFISLVQRRAMSGRSYKDAIDLLNTLQSNAATLDAVKASGGRTNDLAIPEMIEYLGRIGYKVRC